jgi:hypothetical protein
VDWLAGFHMLVELFMNEISESTRTLVDLHARNCTNTEQSAPVLGSSLERLHGSKFNNLQIFREARGQENGYDVVIAEVLHHSIILVREMEIQNQHTVLIFRETLQLNNSVLERSENKLDPVDQRLWRLPVRRRMRIESVVRSQVLGMAALGGTTEYQLRCQHFSAFIAAKSCRHLRLVLGDTHQLYLIESSAFNDETHMENACRVLTEELALMDLILEVDGENTTGTSSMEKTNEGGTLYSAMVSAKLFSKCQIFSSESTLFRARFVDGLTLRLCLLKKRWAQLTPKVHDPPSSLSRLVIPSLVSSATRRS